VTEGLATGRHWLHSGVGLGERLSAGIESTLSRSPWLAPGSLSLAFFLGAAAKARQCPLWNDEVLTRYVSSLPTVGDVWRVLANHAESSPPLFHVVTRISGTAFGWSEFGLRLPAIAGYLTMMLCCYFIVKRYAGPLYAMVAAFSSYLTNAPAYEAQARPYGLLLGLTCIALVCWQRASEGRRRWLAIPGLCLSLAATLGTHYYAVLSFAAIGFGELVRTWRTRRIDWPVWLAIAIASIPMLLLLPLIRSNLVLKTGYFSAATLSNFLEENTTLFLYFGGVLWLLFAILAGACIALFARGQSQTGARLIEEPPIHEIAAWLVLLLAPVLAFVAGKLVTGVFVGRYAIVTIIGFSILLPLCLYRLFKASRAAALASLAFMLLCFVARIGFPCRTEDPRTALMPWLQTPGLSRLPVVVVNPETYLPLAYYAGPELGRNVVYIPDPKQALQYTGMNSADYNLIGLRGLIPLNLPAYDQFLASHREFLVLWEDIPTEWIAPRLMDAGARFTVCSTLGARLVFLVDFPATPNAAGDNTPDPAASMACKATGSPASAMP
jgi:Dolichyl-phosphate-mannose-protein mannosyltransferase